MKNYLKFCFLFLLFAPALTSNAQEKTVITKVKKFKPAVVQTVWGINKNEAIVSREEAIKLLFSPIKIVDAGNNVYTVDNYRFLYRSKSIVENEQTGRKEVSFTVTSDKFTTTPLSRVWIDNIKDNLKPDEQLFFFDVLVKDDQGRLFFAPDLKITIQ